MDNKIENIFEFLLSTHICVEYQLYCDLMQPVLLHHWAKLGKSDVRGSADGKDRTEKFFQDFFFENIFVRSQSQSSPRSHSDLHNGLNFFAFLDLIQSLRA